jgi:alkylation response protein AidB-like acyl-CoA dehydrogenase
MLQQDEQRAVETTLRRFTNRVERALFTGEGADGDLARVPSLLAEARELGFVADPSPEAAGFEWGVWGCACHEEGLRRSLLALSVLGEACAGFAAAVHAQGLACLALGGNTSLPVATVLASAFAPDYGVILSAERPITDGLWLTAAGTSATVQLDGSAFFLLAAEQPTRLVCFARSTPVDGEAAEWVTLWVDAGAPGVELIEVPRAHRTGLRAVRQYHMRCHKVPIATEAVLASGDPALRALEVTLSCDWLGQTAIALGIVRRALRDSRAYTAQRYQGGRFIEGHASIELLRGSAEYDIALLEAILYRHADAPLASLDSVRLLRWAVQARLALVEHGHQAVTDCLQTLGGYGYIEDYGFEKRLRDISTLKILHGAPDQLRLFLNELTTQDRESLR